VYIRRRGPVLIGRFLQDCLTPSHFHPRMLMNLLYPILTKISIQASMILFLHWFPCEWLPWIYRLNRKQGGTLRLLRGSILCSKLSQGNRLYLIILLVIHKDQQILFHTGIHPFRLSIRLRVECCRHWSINPQATAYPAAECGGQLRPSVRNNCCW